MRRFKRGSFYLPSKDLQMKFSLLIYILETPPCGTPRGVPPQLYGSLCTYDRVCVFSSVKICDLTSLPSCRKDQSTGKHMCKVHPHFQVLLAIFKKCVYRERKKKTLNSTEKVKDVKFSKVGGLGPVCVFSR